MGHLNDADLSLALTKDEEADRLKGLQERMVEVRLQLGGLTRPGQREEELVGPPLCVLFEGWDASGKGGAIRRLVSPLDPRHVRVTAYGAPTYDERRHHFLQRFWEALPGWGGMAVFDRSWYGRVLVERVEGFAGEPQWERAYGEIVNFETTLVDEGMVLVKFWMHISDEEQLRRFRAREKNPLKQWKLTDEDWRNRKKRPDYEAAVEEMLRRTDHPGAPWHVVPAESKRYARVHVLETVIAAAEEGLERMGLRTPQQIRAGTAR